MNKTEFVKFRISPESKKHWGAHAKKRGVSISELIRVAMKKECGEPVKKVDLKKLNRRK